MVCTHTHTHLHTQHTHTHTHTYTELAGSNDIENAQIWGVVDEINSLFESMARCHFEKDETRKVHIHFIADSLHVLKMTNSQMHHL